jgi:hypothetical protein
MINIELIKKGLTKDLLPYFNELFPDNKIPLYLSPLSESDNNYITWNQYSSIGNNSSYDDNYCRANDNTLKLYYPTADNETNLKSCNNFFPNNITELQDLNEHILYNVNNIKLNEDIENNIKSNEVKTKLENKIHTYIKIKKELNDQQKTMHNLNNISLIINDLSNKVKINASDTENKVNINYDSINQEQYKYLSTNYYIYTIIVFVIIIFIFHFTVLYY